MSAAVTSGLLTPDARLRRRKLVNHAMEGVGTLAALAAISVLALVVYAVASRGYSALDRNFFTKVPATFGQSATAIALPLGVLVAIYLGELAPPRVARAFSLVLDVLNGLPSIVIGIFIFALFVVGHGQAAWKASVALSIIMLPLVARSTQEVLALVPKELREGSLALGVSRWRSVLGVILPTSFGGILTGATLAVARAAGETAPLLFTSSVTVTTTSWNPHQALQSIPLTIFEFLESPDPADHARAWAAALVLMAFVLILSILAKSALAHSRRKLSR